MIRRIRSWLSRLRHGPRTGVPLPVLVHTHTLDRLPPGPLEKGIVAFERDGVMIHALEGVVNSNGTWADLPEDRFEWARRLSYRHLKREGCLDEYGIPIIAAYEKEADD
jgi:hypothetical protein